jgi:hypothetical protein
MIENEFDWFSCTELGFFCEFFQSISENQNAEQPLIFWTDRPSDRKMRLWAVACCRKIWDQFTDPRLRKVIETAEFFADHRDIPRLRKIAQSTDESMKEAGTVDQYNLAYIAQLLCEPDLWNSPQYSPGYPHWLSLGEDLANLNEDVRLETRQFHAILFHDLLGNPFRPIEFDSSWLTTNVRDLAKTIYNEKAFERMAILADALMDAGCNNDDVLNHCHGPGPHVRGCWVVDLILGKE